jgi:hypothetical protein
MPPKPYDGLVVFVQGVHYPATEDGGYDLTRPLRWDGEGGYRDADEDDPLHNDAHHATDTELEVGGEG